MANPASGVTVGTCGYGYNDPGEGWQDRYESELHAFFDAFPAVEPNRTFYDLPMVRTAEGGARRPSRASSSP